MILTRYSFQPNPICTRGRAHGKTSHQSHRSPPGKEIPFRALEEYATIEAEQTLISKHLELHLRHILDSFPAISNVVFISASEKYSTTLTHHNHINSNFRKAILAYQFFALINAAGRSRCRITKIDVEGPWVWAYHPNNGYLGDDSRIPGSIKYAFPDLPYNKDAGYWKERVSHICAFASFSNSRKTLEHLGIFQQGRLSSPQAHHHHRLGTLLLIET